MAKFARGLVLGTVLLSGVVLLSGCSGDVTVPGASEETSSAATATESSAATATPTATASGTPLTLSCTQILSLQNVYDFNPNFGQNPTFTTPDQIAPLTKIGGVACGWINQTSGDTFAVGVAKPDAVTQAAAANQAAADLQAVPTYGANGTEGFFGVKSGVGVVEVFSKGYWVVLTSAGFLEPGDAAPLVEAVLANLG